jgi:predicted alpha-1,2-mannosidase
MKKLILLFIIPLLFFGFKPAGLEKLELTKYVNPFVGTGGHGHTFPGATVPFGMVQLSPDTRLTGWDGCSGYHYDDSVTYGFSHMHLSGTGVPDYCDILFMPTADNLNSDISYNHVNNFASLFSHAEEKAAPGYYSVILKRWNIKAELTTSTRVGFHKYTYPKEKISKVFVDLKHRDNVNESYIKVISSTEISGYRRSIGWARDQRVYFSAVFSKPFASYGLYLNDEKSEEKKMLSGKNIKALFDFGENSGEVLVKVALSAVSEQNAKMNLDAEINHWDFEKVRKDADEKWNDYLNKIQVKSNDTNKLRIFYTALYHTAICPNTYNDVDGSYLGHDFSVHKSDHEYYTVFSLWDTYRANHPLFNIIERKRSLDFIKTFLLMHQQGGRLPVWELAANETDCMIGYHSVPVITDAYVNGIRGFDEDLALDAMTHSAANDIYGLKFYRQYGYIPGDKEHESVSKTLEYSYDDWCIYKYMEQKGLAKDDARLIEFKNRAQYYKNVFDPQTGFMRPRMNGAWKTPFLATDVDNNYTEANAWQYSLYVPQEPWFFTKVYGHAEKKLDELFNSDSKMSGRDQSDITGLIGQYAHGNEPSHQIAYMYNYTYTPWKTADIAYKVMTEFYKDNPDGCIGNEDCGQMSAWYVMSAMGFYSLCPGSGKYVTGTPLFDEVKINLENGKTFTIEAKNLSDKNIYIDFKKSGLKNPEIFFKDIFAGGKITFEMCSAPEKYRGFLDEDIEKYAAAITDENPVPPIVKADKFVFRDSIEVSLFVPDGKGTIRYTLDGSAPGETSPIYEKPFCIYGTTEIKAITESSNKKSFLTESVLNKIPAGVSIEIYSTPNSQYTAGGPDALIDGIRGPKNWRLGNWQGFQPNDFSAMLTLNNPKEITKVGAGFLQDARSWIWMPVYVEFEVSLDGKNFTKVAKIDNTVSDKDLKVQIVDFVQAINPVKVKYIKIFAKNYGKIPDWHEGAGDDAFIFIDEIFVE